MAEGSTRMEDGVTRREFLKKSGAATAGLTVATGVAAKTGLLEHIATAIVKGLESFFNRPTEVQVEAAKVLAREDLEKLNFFVKDSPEIRRLGGLPAQVEPRIAASGEPPVKKVRVLQPGEEIRDALPWLGTNFVNPGRGPKVSWLTFNDKGTIVFVQHHDDFIVRQVGPNPPLWDRPAVDSPSQERPAQDSPASAK